MIMIKRVFGTQYKVLFNGEGIIIVEDFNGHLGMIKDGYDRVDGGIQFVAK